MNKTTLGLLLAIVVAALAYWYLRAEDAPANSATYPSRAFKVEQADQIQTIRIADMSGKTMSLTHSDEGYWLIDGEFKASPAIMRDVVSALNTIQVDHVPPAASIPTIMESIKSNGLKVTTLDENDQRLSSFILGRTTYDDRNSYAIVDGYDEPFAVRVAGISGTLRPLFDLRSVDSWRSKDFIQYDADAITMIEFAYPLQPGESFRITKKGKGDKADFKVQPLSGLTTVRSKQVPSVQIENYLGVYESVPLDRRGIEQEFRDSITALIPFAVVRLGLENADTATLKFFPWYVKDDYGVPDPSRPVASYFVEQDGKEFVTVQTLQLSELFRNYGSFFGQ